MTELERELRQLLGGMMSFSPSETAEVEQFLQVGEYGVAFETICGIVKEEGRDVPNGLRLSFRRLAEQMDIDQEWWAEIS